jgi:hypothetical protein
MVTGVPFHLTDQPLLLPIHGAQDLSIEPPEFGMLDDPIIRCVERETVVHLKYRQVHHIMPRRQGDVPRMVLGCGWLIDSA